MGRRRQYRCKCDWCLCTERDKSVARFEAKLVDEALVADENEDVYDSWYDWDAEYDL